MFEKDLSKMIETITAVATTAITSGSLLVATVNLDKAELCLPSKECFPVLIGKDTPKGKFNINIYKTSKSGYGGEVLGFHQSGKDLFAIHRVWLGNPKEKRDIRIKSSNISDRLITNGCINISEEGYLKVRNMLTLEVQVTLMSKPKMPSSPYLINIANKYI